VRIWIDLSNSPHPLLFAPIARRLEELGHTVLVTARDNAQTVELARARWPGVEVIGGQSPRSRRLKATAMAGRVLGLRSWVAAARPDVALSHNSYGQIVAARAARIRVVTAMDFEHQPANQLAFRLAHAVLLPKALNGASVRRQGVTDRKARWYDGLKEELYLGDFEPDPAVFEQLAIDRDREGPLVVARTPPGRAAYHRFENPLFFEALRSVASQPGAQSVILARQPEQRRALAALGLPNASIPETAVDSRSLIYGADLVLGAGGTMTREAALMGIPTWSLYAGTAPAVDLWLERRGLLRRMTSIDQLSAPGRRPAAPRPLGELRSRAEAIREAFVHAATGVKETG
jgi:uncharacterized protein